MHSIFKLPARIFLLDVCIHVCFAKENQQGHTKSKTEENREKWNDKSHQAHMRMLDDQDDEKIPTTKMHVETERKARKGRQNSDRYRFLRLFEKKSLPIDGFLAAIRKLQDHKQQTDNPALWGKKEKCHDEKGEQRCHLSQLFFRLFSLFVFRCATTTRLFEKNSKRKQRCRVVKKKKKKGWREKMSFRNMRSDVSKVPGWLLCICSVWERKCVATCSSFDHSIFD